MSYLLQSIKSLYPNAHNVIGNNIDEMQAFDINENVILLDKNLIITKNEDLIAQNLLNECKTKAKALLAATDYVLLTDVPLDNKADYKTYRATLRDLVLNPVADPVFPDEPVPVWK